jgi:hypothetical protein
MKETVYNPWERAELLIVTDKYDEPLERVKKEKEGEENE